MKYDKVNYLQIAGYKKIIKSLQFLLIFHFHSSFNTRFETFQ
jgi:hypothetical protein